MHAFLQFYSQKEQRIRPRVSSGIAILGLMLAAPAAYAGMGGGAGAAAGAGAGGAAGAGGGGAGAGGGGAGAAAGAGGGGAGAGGGGSAGGGGTAHRPNGQTELTICPRGMVLNTKDRRCLAKHSGVRPGAQNWRLRSTKAPSDKKLACQDGGLFGAMSTRCDRPW